MSLESLLTAAFLVPLLQTTLRSTTTLLLTALGGMFSERSGVVNIALEGMIIFGALTAAVSAQLMEAPYLAEDPGARIGWIPWVAVLLAMVVGAFIGWIHAVVSIKYKADQIISGTAINLLAAGLPSLVLAYFYDNTTASKELVNRLPEWLGFSPLVYLAFALVPITWYVMFKTPWGLRLRSVGFVFQASNLLEALTARENVEVVLNMAGVKGRAAATPSTRAVRQRKSVPTVSRPCIAGSSSWSSRLCWRPH